VVFKALYLVHVELSRPHWLEVRQAGTPFRITVANNESYEFLVSFNANRRDETKRTRRISVQDCLTSMSIAHLGVVFTSQPHPPSRSLQLRSALSGCHHFPSLFLLSSAPMTDICRSLLSPQQLIPPSNGVIVLLQLQC